VEEIEEQIMLDDDFFQEVEIVERELLDEYLQGDMKPEEAQLFRQNFLQNESRQEGLRFAAALKKKIDSTNPVPIRTGNTTVNAPLSRLSWSRSLFALAALPVVLLGGISIHLANSVKQEQALVASLDRQLREARRREDTGRLQDEFAVAYLSKTLMKGEESPEISLAPGVRAIQFILPVPRGFKSEVSVKLLDDLQHVITIDSPVFPRDIGQEHVLIATFPAEKLSHRNYFLKLEADEKQPHAVDVNGNQYPFKIR
jgi:hypothetical protein